MSEPAKPAAPAAAAPPKRSGHRGQDVRDTVAEMAAKAHEISLEAGSKMAASMKEVVGAAAGLIAFSIDSARDLVQYMVRRGQMTQAEADKLIRSAEDAWVKKHKGKLPPRPSALSALKPLVAVKAMPTPAEQKVAKKAVIRIVKQAAKKAAKKVAKKPAAKKPAKKPAAKKPAAKKPAAKKPAAKKPAAKKPSKKK